MRSGCVFDTEFPLAPDLLGFVATERAVIQGMIGILNGILSGMVGNPVLTSDFQTRLARLNDLRKSMSLLVFLSALDSPSHKFDVFLETEYWGIH